MPAGDGFLYSEAVNRRARGGSLIELKFTLVAIAVLAPVAIPFMLAAQSRADHEKQDRIAELLAMMAASDGRGEAPAARAGPIVTIDQPVGPPTPLPDYEVLREGSSTVFRSTTSWWVRWLLLPFLGFVLAGLIGGAFFAVGPKVFRQDPEPVKAKVAMVGVLWVLATVAFTPPVSILEFRGDAALIRRSRTWCGIALGTAEEVADARGIAAVPFRSGYAVVAVAGERTERRAVELLGLGKGDLAAVATLRAALATSPSGR
jgi:hypothetical protein